MHFTPLIVANIITHVLLGLAVAASGGLVYGRSRPAAGFLGVAGLAYVVGQLLILAMQPTWHHFSWNVVGLALTAINWGKYVVFYGGIALALRAIAVSTPQGEP